MPHEHELLPHSDHRRRRLPRDGERGANKTVASLQHAMLVDSPYVYTQEDVLFITWFERQTIPHMSEEDIAHLRDEFFANPQACLRASPLPKRYGWGVALQRRRPGGAVPDGLEGIRGPCHR